MNRYRIAIRVLTAAGITTVEGIEKSAATFPEALEAAYRDHWPAGHKRVKRAPRAPGSVKFEVCYCRLMGEA